ncbi:MAG: zinc-binding dehydrogenase [Phycisphaeraceae bacterium]|nr:zinc-binding dehydrogenase [Phycisphaeraceae bacterium]
MNHLDLWGGRGLPGVEVEWPFTSGSDGVGVVDRVGPGVDEAWIGKRVILNAAIMHSPKPKPGERPAGEDIEMIGEHRPGTHAEFFVAPAANLIEVGDSDPVEAAAFGLTHLTAWRMLISRGRVRPGQSVLIPGIGGGVALAALGLARHLGCITIVTSRSAEKLERAKALGADHAILDSGADWSREVRAATGRRGVDLCIESVGKAVFGACLKSLARGGTLVTCGTTTGGDATCDLTRVFWNQLSVVGSTMGTMEEFAQVLALFRAGLVRPVVDSIHHAEHGQEAFRRLESGAQFGKVVIVWQ